VPKLLEQVRDLIRLKHYSLRTEAAYLHWIKEYITFHKKRHPAEMGSSEISQFLSHLAVNRKVAASTPNQALSALLFLYREDVSTTMIYTHVMNRGGEGVRSPMDRL
jgi:site-specific recombinase XerD